MFRKMRKNAGFAVVAASVLVIAAGAAMAGDSTPIQHLNWSFDGPFGTYDKAQLQRGFQVYKEVCSACHSLNLVAFRDLDDLGFSKAEVKAIAAGYQITDGPNDQGNMFQRPGKPSDHFPPPFPNDEAARAANGGALPPDQSLLAKAREDGPDYIYAVLTGFTDPPAGMTITPGMSYNKAFPGHQIAMPPPLSKGSVTFADGTPATVDNMARDVSAFLMWTAEPKLEQRKEIGFRVMVFMGILTIMLYFTKKKVWSDVDNDKSGDKSGKA